MDSHVVPGGCFAFARVIRLGTVGFLVLASSGVGRSGCRATVQCVTPWVARRYRYTAALLSPETPPVGDSPLHALQTYLRAVQQYAGTPRRLAFDAIS